MTTSSARKGPNNILVAAVTGLAATFYFPATGMADVRKSEPSLHIQSDREPRHEEYKIHSLPGVLMSQSNTVRCDTVCDQMTEYDSFFDVARLKGGGFAALKKEPGDSFSWRQGETLRDVTSARKLLVAPASPRRTPGLAGFKLKRTARLMESQDLFVGVWTPTNENPGGNVIGLFSDDKSQRIEGLNVQGVCRLATVDAPVIALASEPSLHGEMWPVVIIVRRPKAANAQIISFSLFPSSLQCNGKLKAASPKL